MAAHNTAVNGMTLRQRLAAPVLSGGLVMIIIGNNLPNVLIGTPVNDIIRGLGGNDLIRGLGGNDLLDGGTGNDRMFGDAGHDRMFGGAGNDTMDGGAGVDRLFGDAGSDKLFGGADNDLLDGGLGIDEMRGGLGNDVYMINQAGDRVIENPGEGIDRVISLVNMSLGANLENLTLAGNAFSGVGNELSNVVIGNNSRNLLSGGTDGNDALLGGGGADLLIGGIGNDGLNGGSGNDDLRGGVGRDSLTGGLGADTFRFISAFDSQPPVLGEDVINDFFRAQGDKINVSLVDANTTLPLDQAFVFIGESATPGIGQLSIVRAGSQTFVRGNTDADAAIEFEFRVLGNVPDQPADYVL
jgi:serralysin